MHKSNVSTYHSSYGIISNVSIGVNAALCQTAALTSDRRASTHLALLRKQNLLA